MSDSIWNVKRTIDLEAERIFENRKVSGASPRARQARFYWATGIGGGRFDDELLKKTAGKAVIEIGCSSGDLARNLSPSSSLYVGLDISDEAIKSAESLNLEGAKFLCTDGHTIPFADESFDLVIAKGVLHHLDLDTALPEIHRVLRSDGLLAFDEPLGINPLFGIYRAITPKARTVDEKPFGRVEIRVMKQFFSLSDVEFFGLFSIFSAFGKSSIPRKILTDLDRLIAKTSLRWLMWRFAGFAKKVGV